MDIEIKNLKSKNHVHILAFSDWRVQNYEDLYLFSQQVPKYDIVVYAGDDLDRLIEAKYFVEKIVNKSESKRLLFVAGNDDVPPDKRILKEFGFAHDLHEAPFFYKNFAFIGIEGSTGDMGFILYSESQIKEKLDAHLAHAESTNDQKNSLLILVSHTPPHGILDYAMRHSETGLARSIGSTSVLEFLESNKVPLSLCGHVHLFGGQSTELSNGNNIINIASHDSPYAEGKIALVSLSRSGKTEANFYGTFDLFLDSELRKLSEIGHQRVQQLNRNGILNLSDVTEQNRTSLKVRNVGDRLITKWIRQANLLQNNFQGVEFLAPQAMKFLKEKRHIIWDIETDLSQSHIWLIGAYDTLTKEMRQFFNPDDEKDCIGQFTKWLESRSEAIPISFSGSRFDSRVLEKSLRKYGIIDSTFFTQRDVDLCMKIRYDCISTYSALALKTLASEMGFKFRHTEIDGFYVGQVFSQYLKGIKPEDWNDFIEYNEDDVLATLFVFNELKTVSNYL